MRYMIPGWPAYLFGVTVLDHRVPSGSSGSSNANDRRRIETIKYEKRPANVRKEQHP